MSRSFLVSVIISAFLFVVVAVFYLVPPLNNPDIYIFHLITGIIYEITLIVPLVFLIYSYLGIERQWKGRIAWLLIFLAMLAYVIGDTIWTVYDTGFMLEVPYPGLPDIFYVAFYPIMILAMLRLMKVADVKLSGTEIVLFCIIAALLAAETAGRVIVPNLLDVESPWGARLLDSFYPVGDVVIFLMGIMILVMFWGGKVTTTYILFLSGILVLTVTDVLYSFVSGDFGFSNPLDLGWAISYFLIGLAGVYERSLHERMRKGVQNA